MTKIDQIAQAFAQGVKFAENLKLAMDAAKGKDDTNNSPFHIILLFALPSSEKKSLLNCHFAPR